MKKLTKRIANKLISAYRFTTRGRFFNYNDACQWHDFTPTEADKMEEIFRMTDTNMTKAEVVDYMVAKYNAA